MTDGIIQKVFKTYIDRNRRYNDDAYYGELFENQAKEFEQLKQELIEEIKKSHNNGGCDITCGNTKDCRFIEELIGDNE
jgi:hypothetical protein